MELVVEQLGVVSSFQLVGAPRYRPPGRNLPHLPASASALLAVDPLEAGRHLAAERLSATTVAVKFVGLDGEALALPDDSVGPALSTWTLCSIPNPVAAVREIVRVLRPGGVLPRTASWQRRLNPIQQRIACGCHLDRDIPSILHEGGLKVTELDTYYMAGERKVLGWTFEGSARAA